MALLIMIRIKFWLEHYTFYYREGTIWQLTNHWIGLSCCPPRRGIYLCLIFRAQLVIIYRFILSRSLQSNHLNLFLHHILNAPYFKFRTLYGIKLFMHVNLLIKRFFPCLNLLVSMKFAFGFLLLKFWLKNKSSQFWFGISVL